MNLRRRSRKLLSQNFLLEGFAIIIDFRDRLLPLLEEWQSVTTRFARSDGEGKFGHESVTRAFEQLHFYSTLSDSHECCFTTTLLTDFKPVFYRELDESCCHRAKSEHTI